MTANAPHKNITKGLDNNVNDLKSNLYSVRFDIGNQHDVQEDFTLPDYMSEVRRIVSCKASVLPENLFIDQSELVLSGLVMYTVLYVGDDGKLTNADLNSEYTARLGCGACDLSGLSAESIPYVTQLISCTCRATGPRRLSLSARMSTRAVSAVQGKHTEIITDKSDGTEKSRCDANDISLERHVLEVDSTDVVRHSTTGSISGSFRENSESKIISCNATMGVTDIRQDERFIKVSGSAYLNCLFMTPDSKYYSVKERCPFEETMSVGGSVKKVTGDVSATARCAGINITGSDNGEYKWELEYDLDVFRDTPHTSCLTDDIYSTSFETDCELEDISRLVCLKNGNSRLSLNGSRLLGGGEKSLVQANGRVVTDRAEYSSDGHLSLSGSCIVQTIIDEEGNLKAEEITIPVKFECVGKPSDGICHVLCSVDVLNTELKLDGDKLTADAELCISFLAYAVNKTSCVASCSVDTSHPLDFGRSCVRVYFPEESETIWDIGKKYHCKPDKIEVLGKNMPVIINV